jgi:hypothetical protein
MFRNSFCQARVLLPGAGATTIPIVLSIGHDLMGSSRCQSDLVTNAESRRSRPHMVVVIDSVSARARDECRVAVSHWPAADGLISLHPP